MIYDKEHKETTVRVCILKIIIVSALFASAIVGFVHLALDAALVEDDWRADRLCRHYDICDPTRGP